MPALWRWDGRAGPFSGSGAACTCGTSTTRTPSPPRPSALASHPHPPHVEYQNVSQVLWLSSFTAQLGKYILGASHRRDQSAVRVVQWCSGQPVSAWSAAGGRAGCGGAVQLQEWEGHGADTSCHRLSLDVRPAPGARRVYMRRLAAATHCPSRPERLVTVTTCYRFTFNCQMRTYASSCLTSNSRKRLQCHERLQQYPTLQLCRNYVFSR